MIWADDNSINKSKRTVITSNNEVKNHYTASVHQAFEERIKGDLTGDGAVAMNDVIKLARAVAGNVTLTADEQTAADVTGDGDIAMNDVIKLARFVAGTIKEL